MAIYRGPGGSGDAINDSSSETRLAVEARDAAIAAQAAAEAAQAAAETAETNAELAETNAETAETNAETAEANAETAEANAEAAQAAAEAAQAAAETAQTAAELAETNAETAETNAETAASLAQEWATKLSTPVSGSDYSAKYNANLAAASASAAQTAETNAETAQAAAEAARDAALSAYDNFDDRYLGPKSSDPSLDNDGNALVTGALYFNTTSSVMKVYTGSAWVAAYVSAAGVLLVANNLSDVANAATARTNLGVAIGTNVQAWDADLDTWSTKTSPSGTVVGTSDSQTLTSKTIALGSNTVSGTLAEFNTAVTDADLVSIAGTETLTNKTLTSPTISGGSINNATVGASSASTGAFTTATASTSFTSPIFKATNSAGGALQNSSGTNQLQWGGGGGNNLSVDVAININPANAQVAISPTGTGSVTINPATAGTINNMSIGATTASTGAFTTLSATGVATVSAGTVSAPAITTSGDTNTGIYFPAADTIAFTEGGTEVMRINSSGNVGVGTASPATKLQVNGQTRITDGTTNIDIVCASTTGFIGTQTNAPLVLRTNDTERARIDTTGNLSIGATGFTNVRLLSKGTNTASDTYAFLARNSSDTDLFAITNAGNVGIATSSPVSALDVNGKISLSGGAYRAINYRSGNSDILYEFDSGDFYRQDIATSSHQFFTANNERMRIDSSGRLLVGRTSTVDSSKLTVENNDSTVGVFFNTNASNVSTVLQARATRNTTNNSFYAFTYYNEGAGADKLRIADSGNVTNTNNSYGSISDIKLKENIVDATPKLEKICQVKVRNFNIIGDAQKQIGVVAQELEQVFPSMVEESPDRDVEGNDLGTVTKQVKYSVFVPMLIKAIQEQQAIITDLKSRITALENK